MRVLRKFPEEWLKQSDISSLRYIFLAGEPLDEPTYQWATAALGKQILDHYWQTESGVHVSMGVCENSKKRQTCGEPEGKE